jgi:hypothetical protein
VPFDSFLCSSHLDISASSLPKTTLDVIRHLADQHLAGSVAQQMRKGGVESGCPSVLVRHSHEADWKETVEAVCTFCRWFFILVGLSFLLVCHSCVDSTIAYFHD